VIVSPPNAGLPVTISYTTHAKDHTSVRRSTAFPRACSGLMYAAVRRRSPAAVRADVTVGEAPDPIVPDAGSGPTLLASPKSRTFATPASVIRMFAGLR